MSIQASFRHRLIFRLRLVLALLVAASALPRPGFAAPVSAQPDPVILSFAFVGCNRLDHLGSKATRSDSTANAAQLLRSFADVSVLRPAPRLLILAGDIVKAKKPGTDALARQLKAWQKLVKQQLPESIRLVAFTGNHELLMSNAESESEDDAEIPNPPAYAYWQRAMRPYLMGSDGPAAGGGDGLLDDESRLSYSFAVGSVLFIVLNTDSLVDGSTAGDVPLTWLGERLAAAQQDGSVEHVFVMGHKPAAVKGKVPDSGQSNIRASQLAAFAALLNRPGPAGAPTKVRAYLAAHAHEWSYLDHIPLSDGSGHVPQIIAGNGGSPPEGNWNATGNYFGFTVVSVMGSGRITAQSYGRTIPAPDYWLQTPPAPPATPRGAPVVLRP